MRSGFRTLLAGHSCRWLGTTETQAYPSPDVGAEASGNVSLSIGTAAVPEFSSVIVWSLVVMTLGGAAGGIGRN